MPQDKVTPLFQTPLHAKRPYKRPELQDTLFEVNVSQLGKGPNLMECLESQDLGADARGIWMGYPNLNQSTQSLVHWVGMEWPSRSIFHENGEPSSAVAEAVASAIQSVKKALSEGSVDRKLITAAYFEGLNVIAASLCGVTANGFVDNKLVSFWTPMNLPLYEWVERYKLDRLVFNRRNGSDTERIGQSWIVRARIASAMDVGLMDRHAKI